MSLLLVFWSGLVAGGVHVVTGVDHLAALLPLSVGRRARAFVLGARWGIGHSLGVLLVALVAVALREQMDLHAASAVGERLVGAMLLGIGAFGLRNALRIEIHAHPHVHEGRDHEHLHVHAPRRPHRDDESFHRHTHAALAAGTVHGVAGTAHVLGVLPAIAMPSWASSGVYLAAFALGTILSMGGFAAMVGETSARAGSRGPAILKGLLAAASCGAILVGTAWIALPLLGFALPA
jgi:ABC-type nickel/cobalt efflux system permease component RcnA